MSSILKCDKLTKKYGDTVAINELDLAVEPGRIVGLFGVEGSGKTTLLKLAAGLLTPESGKILIAGNTPGVKTKRATAFMPASNSLDERAHVKYLLRFYRDFYEDFDEETARAMLSDAGIDLNDKISDLSNSNTKKLLVTLTVSRRAKLFLFDDPVGGADTSTMSYILDAIAAKRPADSAVIITSRTPADVERIIQDAAFISAGRITLFADAEGLRAEKGKSVNAFFAEVNRC